MCWYVGGDVGHYPFDHIYTCTHIPPQIITHATKHRKIYTGGQKRTRRAPEAEEAPGEVGDGLEAVVDVELRGHEDEAVGVVMFEMFFYVDVCAASSKPDK